MCMIMKTFRYLGKDILRYIGKDILLIYIYIYIGKY